MKAFELESTRNIIVCPLSNEAKVEGVNTGRNTRHSRAKGKINVATIIAYYSPLNLFMAFASTTFVLGFAYLTRYLLLIRLQTMKAWTAPNHLPKAPLAVPQGLLTSKICSNAMRTKNHKFYTMWGEKSLSVRQPSESACWGGGDWFEWAMTKQNCAQPWGRNIASPTVLGFEESMEGYCNKHAGNGWRSNDELKDADKPYERPVAIACACGQAQLNILDYDDWNMCRNAEWMMCINGNGAGGDGSFIFTYMLPINSI